MKGHKNLTLAAYDIIKEMMFNYDIIPGQRLVFVDLANQLGVSRTPINNALSILAKEGYLDFVPNQGYSVHRLTREEAESLYEIREILETGAIKKAIPLATEKKLKIVEEKMIAYEKAITDRVQRKLFILDTEFHSAMIEMTENQMLAERYQDVCQRIFLRFRVEDLKVERLKEIVSQHKQLFAAVYERDVQKAEALIRSHHQDGMHNIFAIIFKNDRR